MVRSLWTAASGMNSQQFNVDTIANNLANVNTGGFRKSRAEFEDLVYANANISGSPATNETVRPLDISIGHGSRVAASQKIFTQGIIRAGENFTDMAILGEGFFRVTMPDGSYGYTRNGAFKLDASGQLVTEQGFRVEPDIIFPEGFIPEDITVSRTGIVGIIEAGQLQQIGAMQLYRFTNPAGLNSVGENIFKETGASGEPVQGDPGAIGFGEVRHKFLEYSNVNMAEEMVNMIVAQRAYEFNSKAIQTSDTMLGTAVSLKR